MTAPTRPMLTGAVRELLLGDAAFASLCGGRLGSKSPADVTTPYATMSVSATPIAGGGVVWRCTAQVKGCCSVAIGGLEPEEVAWDIAAAAARVFDHARNVVWRNVAYSGRVELGPMPGSDLTRSESEPVYWALVRADLTAHLR